MNLIFLAYSVLEDEGSVVVCPIIDLFWGVQMSARVSKVKKDSYPIFCLESPEGE
jgi:hypothetical protein